MTYSKNQFMVALVGIFIQMFFGTIAILTNDLPYKEIIILVSIWSLGLQYFIKVINADISDL